MAKEKIDIGQIIYDETEKRLDEMSSSEYEWPKKAAKWNYVVIVASIVICLALIIMCMTGVIK